MSEVSAYARAKQAIEELMDNCEGKEPKAVAHLSRAWDSLTRARQVAMRPYGSKSEEWSLWYKARATEASTKQDEDLPSVEGFHPGKWGPPV